MSFQLTETSLTISNAKAVYASGVDHMKKKESVHFDVKTVKFVDTAGVSVLIAWWQYGLKKHVKCHFEVSEAVEETLRVYNIELP